MQSHPDIICGDYQTEIVRSKGWTLKVLFVVTLMYIDQAEKITVSGRIMKVFTCPPVPKMRS